MKTAQDIIIKPVITEESMMGIMMKKYTFKVAKNANKVEIAKAVEQIENIVAADKAAGKGVADFDVLCTVERNLSPE